MERLKLSLRCENGVKCPPELRKRIKAAARAVLDAEQVEGPCELSVLLTDDGGIRQIFRRKRERYVVCQIILKAQLRLTLIAL